MAGIRKIARDRGVEMLVSGFGSAFSVHFTSRTELREYRDVLDDDTAALGRFLYSLLDEGVHCLPDGRFYLSAMHGAKKWRRRWGRLGGFCEAGGIMEL